MHRLFVAIRPPAPVRAALLDAMGEVAGARWQSDDQLHLTLRFIGEVDRRTAEDIAAALDAIRFPAFDVALAPLGTFDQRGRPAVIWAGVVPSDPLKALRAKVEQACVRAGLEPERRAFHPHITLARLGRGAGAPAGAFDASPAIARLAFRADAFALFESRLGSEGAAYEEVARFPLERTGHAG